MHARTITSEFPEYPTHTIPADIFTDWEDTSWHNDACPSFVRGRWHVFVDFPEPDDRECGGERFTVSHYDPKEGVITDYLATSEIWEPLRDIITRLDALR